MAYIELKDVTYTYPLVKEPALKNITASFEKGKFYGIIGENAGGKTTLCNLIRGLIPHFYKGKLKGEVTIDGQDLRELDIDILATQIGYIFQNPFTQISGVKKSVFEEIALGMENLGIPKQEIIERVFVIDEPTSQLDPDGTAGIFEIIHTLKEQGKTIILVEHKIDLLAEYADEILVLQGGKLIKKGSTQEVLTDFSLLDRGVMLPHTALFYRELEKTGKKLEHVPVTRNDCMKQLRDRLV